MTALNPPAFIGLQLILPVYLREGFVQAALSYIACNGEGEFDCKDNDCWCHCEPKFPQCNCPYMDIQAMEESLQRITETWGVLYKDFEESGTKLSRKIPHILLCVLHSSPKCGNSYQTKEIFAFSWYKSFMPEEVGLAYFIGESRCSFNTVTLKARCFRCFKQRHLPP